MCGTRRVKESEFSCNDAFALIVLASVTPNDWELWGVTHLTLDGNPYFTAPKKQSKTVVARLLVDVGRYTGSLE